MKSMTGYGSSEYQDSKIDLTVELKSYNNKYLDISVNIPSFISSLEPQIRNYLAERIMRGKVDICIRIREIEENASILIDRAVASAAVEALTQLQEITGLKEKISLSHLLRMEGVVKKIRNRDSDHIWEILLPVLEKAYNQFDQTRSEEALKLETDIKNQLEIIRKNLKIIQGRSLDIEEEIKNNLKTRFIQLLGNNVDENRIYAETAVQLVRFSINEEIVRLDAHIEVMEKTLGSEDMQIGKKLDFICQEINREINTIGSKSFILEINQSVIDIKDALEKIREQVRNIS